MVLFHTLKNYCCNSSDSRKRLIICGVLFTILIVVPIIFYISQPPIKPPPLIKRVRKVLLLNDGAYVDDENFLARYTQTSNMELTVIHGGIENYTGLPSATTFHTIILFPRAWFGVDMPISGQQEILHAQNTGTGIVLTEWAGWRVHQQSQWKILSALCLIFPQGQAFVPRITFTNLQENHPLWNGLPSTFTSVEPLGTSTNYIHARDTMVVAKCESCGGALLGVVIQDQSDQGKGRIVQINYQPPSNATLWNADQNNTRLLMNAIRWAAKIT